MHEALDAAKDKGLDLVEVAANAKPPVCRIMDYSKYKFEKNKKEKEARKKQRQHQVDVKEIKFRPKIEEHDYNVKLKHIRRFLTDGDKVKIVIRYRGREIMFLDSGTELLNKTLLPFVAELVISRIADKNTLLDAPTLFESGINRICTKTVAVLADREIRLKRIIGRDGLTIKEANLRINAGKTDEFYKKNADYIIYNNGDEEAFLKKFTEIMKEITGGNL